MRIDISRPLHREFHEYWHASLLPKPSLTDKAYAIVFLGALGLSVLILFLSWYVSRNPVFPKEVIALPRFRHVGYESLPTHAENGNGVDHERKESKALVPEKLKGWRLRLGLFQSAVLAALLAVYAIILVTVGPTLLRIVFIAYWVPLLFCTMLTKGAYFILQYLSLFTYHV